MQDAVIAVGPDDRVQWANHTMDKLVPQRTRLQAPLVETIRDPDFLRAVRGASETRKVLTARAASILPGQTFDVTSAPMPGGGAVAVLRDLTETERVEKTRRDFIANVSHELRTPLTSIQGYTETLLETPSENNHSRDFLEIIRKNATRMARLTEDLLTLARVESGEQRFEVQPVGSEELLQEAVQSFHEVARTQGIELAIENGAHASVQADREAIHQVFSNLIDNALKYGGPWLRPDPGMEARFALHSSEFYLLGRLLTISFALLSLPLTHAVGRRAFNEPVALLGAWFALLMPVAIDHAQMVRSDSAAAFFGVLGLWLCLRVHDRPGTGSQVMAGIAIGLAIASRYVMVALIPALLLVDGAILLRTENGRQGFMRTGIVFGLLSIPLAFALSTPYVFLEKRKGGVRGRVLGRGGPPLAFAAAAPNAAVFWSMSRARPQRRRSGVPRAPAPVRDADAFFSILLDEP